MDSLQTWFSSLETAQQFYWVIAIISSVIFIIQTLLTFIGIDAVDGADMDFDTADGDTMDAGGAMSLFSVRSLVNFAVGFGWSGITLRESIGNGIVLTIVSFVIGVAFGAMYPYMKKKLMKLETNGSYKIADCVGKQADVYLRIPASGQGRGKVQVSINGSIHEIDAISVDEEIPTGARVTIIKAEGNVLTVKP
ncbi:MAG: NfeD family protein [Prevotella sp.]|nr:NfeD family protein [Candidatus Prevotella equi]